jgi:pentatricopeptide repeat domain-containing protein 1
MLQSNVTSFNAAISACEKDGKWKRALSLLDELRERGAVPDLFSAIAAISACQKGGTGERAMSLLDEMRVRGVAPDVIIFNATISAGETGGKWERAVSLLDEMCECGVRPNVISFNAAIYACEARLMAVALGLCQPPVFVFWPCQHGRSPWQQHSGLASLVFFCECMLLADVVS